jgi:serine/threonine protein kinase
MSSIEPNVGDTIRGRFVLEKQLGVGGMGRVFRALDLLRQEAHDREPYVAIKFVSDAFRNQPISFIALQREAKKAQKLTHRNIVRVYDFDRDDHLIFIVMEYLSGTSLESIIKQPQNRGLSINECLKIIEPVASALSFAHENGIIHLDIKPSNIFLTSDGNVKVIDFGIASAVRAPDDREPETVFDPRMFGAMTAAYASPETIDGLEPDPRDDVYSLAVVTYELITGRHPFDRISSVKARAMKRQPAKLATLSRRQWSTLRKALLLDRSKRIASVADFIAGLRRGSALARRWKRVATYSIIACSLLVGAGYSIQKFIGGDSADVSRRDDAPVIIPPAKTQQPESQIERPPAASPPQSAHEIMSRETKDSPDGSPISPPIDAPVPTADRVSELARQAPCTLLSSIFLNGGVHLVGFAGHGQTVVDLRSSMENISGVGYVNTDQIRFVPSTYCGALDVYRHPAANNVTKRLGVFVRNFNESTNVYVGDELVLLVKGAKYPSYIYIDYFTLDGSVIHMLPNAATETSRIPAEREMRLGAGAVGNWIIGEPVGTEMIAVLTSPVPLFEENRQENEPADAYLNDLRSAIMGIEEQRSVDTIAADLLFMTTKASR